jgi:hypothetical protein
LGCAPAANPGWGGVRALDRRPPMIKNAG